MNGKGLVCAAVFASGLVSSGMALAASLGSHAGISLGDTPPSQCQASGLNECYYFVNNTGAAGTTVPGGTTLSVTLTGTGSCNAYQWSIPAGQSGWLWSNPGAGGCVVSSITFGSIPGPTTPAIPASAPQSVISQGGAGTQHTTLFVVTLGGTTTAPTFTIANNVFN